MYDLHNTTVSSWGSNENEHEAKAGGYIYVKTCLSSLLPPRMTCLTCYLSSASLLTSLPTWCQGSGISRGSWCGAKSTKSALQMSPHITPVKNLLHKQPPSSNEYSSSSTYLYLSFNPFIMKIFTSLVEKN